MPAKSFIPEEHREAFLEMVSEGKTRQEAAAELGYTATKFKNLVYRDAEFRERYYAIIEDVGGERAKLRREFEDKEMGHLMNRLLDEFIARGLDSEKAQSPSSNKILRDLLAIFDTRFRPLVQGHTRHVHEGAIGVYSMPTINTSLWSLEEHREFVQLRRRMTELLAIAAPQNAGMLPAGEEEVIDAEHEEIEAA